MKIVCSKCNTPIHTSDISLNQAVAKCSKCGAVYDLMDIFSNPEKYQTFNKSIDIPLPERFELNETFNELVITRKWFSPLFIFLAVFCIIWDGFLIFWYSLISSVNTQFLLLIIAVFPLIHLIIGLGLTYYTIAGFFNSTIIKVDNFYLSVKHKPLPWFGNKIIDVLEISQLFSNQQVSRFKSDTIYSYDVNIITKDNRTINLIKGLPEKHQALFIEQKIERFLKIKDEPITN